MRSTLEAVAVREGGTEAADAELIKTLRFFEGLGKPLSTWEIEMLARAEKEGGR